MTNIGTIAIVGIGGIFPRASDLDGFWNNILKGVNAARKIPEERWILPLEKAYDPNKGVPDKVYSKRGCFVEGSSTALIPQGLRISPSLLKELDPMFHLLLYAGHQAFNDAVTENIDRSRVGVIIGNIVLPTEKASAMALEYLGRTFEERVLGRPNEKKDDKIRPLNRYVAGLPAGVLAKALGLGNGSFTLDAACASSLYALKLASDQLLSGRADAVLTGGVSRPDCLYTQMGFSQLRAISATGVCAPFDKNADGLVVGEGAGLFTLKRTEDALRDGDHIYAVIAGIGLSNDVGGSLLAPDTEGQLRAMEPAYEEAGWDPRDVDLIECHATGTPVGDKVEFESLKAHWGTDGWSPGQCVIGSVKSNIGHLLTAAGSAALIKVLMALKNKTLPPTANFSTSHPGLAMDTSPFTILTEPKPWTKRAKDTPRRAAVNAFGFGGINAHVLIEEWTDDQTTNSVSGNAGPQSHNLKSEIPNPKSQIAIIGMDAHFGPWNGLDKFCERVLGNTEETEPSSIHNWRGAQDSFWFRNQGLDRFPFNGYTIHGFSVSLDKFRIPPKEIEEMLPQQSLMLQIAGRAILDAGLTEKDRMRTGVFIGIGLDLNTTNFQLRWWIPDKAQDWANQLGQNLSNEELDTWIQSLRKAAGPPLTANRTMGALGGIVASRIAREFHIGGPSFTISSEESSGIRALETAVRLLENGTIDHAVVGAVDLASDIRSVLGTHFGRAFSASGKIRPFEPDADGTIIGEGAAAVILKRLDPAASGDSRIYAVIKGIGVAAGGGIESLVPDAKTCRTAMQRAYDDGDVDPSSVSYLEAHGSGIPAEDRMETQALQKVFTPGRNDIPCPLGSVKADIGHTGAASGMASLVKLCLCLDREIQPPIRRPDQNSRISIPDTDFSSLPGPQYWLRNREQGPRRAALNCFSMDGNCTHVILEAFEKHERSYSSTDGLQPLGPVKAALFSIEADHVSGIQGGLDRLYSHIRQFAEDSVGELAEKWHKKNRLSPENALCLTFTPHDRGELPSLIDHAKQSLTDNPAQSISPMPKFPVSFSPNPLGKTGKTAFVFPGSGNYFPGMGRNLSAQWPEIFQRQDLRNSHLRDQFIPELFWDAESIEAIDLNPRDVISGQVALGTAVSDLIRSFGVRPDAAIGYSLGESAALFSLNAWTDRDEMLRRMNASTLFTHDLAGPCNAARKSWKLSENEEVDWVSGVIDCPEEEAKKVLKGRERVYLLIVNTLNECVLGGNRRAVETVVKTLGCRFFPLSGVTTVHCDVARVVERPYHELHLFETSPPPDITFYSCALERAYEVNRKNAADSILAQAVNSINFPRLIDAAYEDGIRIFLEMGPGSSCTRMIGNILDSRPHMALSACAPGQDNAASVLRLLGRLLSERVPVDLGVLYGGEASTTEYRTSQPPASIIIPIGGKAFMIPTLENGETGKRRTGEFSPEIQYPVLPSLPSSIAHSMEPILRQAEAAETAGIQAHEEYLRLSTSISQTLSDNLAFQMTLVEAMRSLSESGTAKRDKPAVAFDRPMCLEFAVGSVAGMLGPEFAPIDSHHTRVRLPDEPLMLVDRIVSVEGEPRSLTTGRVITEHDILPGAWYLDHGRIPTCIAVEAGQADLFLSAYLGIDFKTDGLAVYRLLDAAVTFHRELPGPGAVIRYDIRIERFFRQGETHLFRFNFEGAVNGEPLLTMTDGCAGFFTLEELVAGQGVVHTELDLRPLPGIRPNDWQDFVPMNIESYGDHQINALRSGNLAGCFGPTFEGLGLENPLRIPGGRMALVDRVVLLDPGGGRFGLGIIRAEADIHPDDWFLTCHFIDDPVMPGTLMYECCLHTLRIFLLRMGWVGEKASIVCGPVPGVAGRLKCRGQVIETTQKVTYEISIKELGYRPEPYAIVDALMYADDKLIVEITDMSIRFSGLTKQKIAEVWSCKKKSGSKDSTPEILKPEVLFDHDRILAFAVGRPSEAFGEPYRVFDSERFIARLPGPPYQFLDCITGIDAEQWQMKPGGTAETQYHVPADAWYFKACGMPELPEMPFAVLMEVALQSCGWLAAYMGSALTSDSDLSFRNLGGTAVQYGPVLPDTGTLTTSVKVMNVSTSAGMIIQNYDFEVRNEGRPMYKGETYFGFFTKQALADQLGIRDAGPYEPTPEEIGKGLKFDYPEGLLFPHAQLRMVDRTELFVPDGGPNGLGFIRGTKGIDFREWFFKAHFFEDPVWPGSLGLESFLQLIRVVAVNRWGIGVWAKNPDIQTTGPGIRNFTMVPGERHSWLYRGQVLPSDKLVTVQASVTSIDDINRRIRADGFLMVDGRVIYQINDFEIMAT